MKTSEEKKMWAIKKKRGKKKEGKKGDSRTKGYDISKENLTVLA